jgi:hypothetical protein
MVPPPDRKPWPTLGDQVSDWIEANLVFGPGDLRGQPARLDDEKRGLLYRMYEVYPRRHPMAGRRRFNRAAISLRKGSAKSEFAAWIAAAELHPRAPVRSNGFHPNGKLKRGIGVIDPYIPLVAYTEEQSEDLIYGALRVVLELSAVRADFDIGLERIMRVGGDGKAVALAAAPNARDGALTTFQAFDEPLALDTPVPTPDGWATIAELGPGDHVFGRDGKPAVILGTSAIHEGRSCYRVVFVDGSSVVTDAGHRWSAVDRRHHQRGTQSITTEQMAAEVVISEWGTPTLRWAVPYQDALELPERQLPVEPYTLGVWLGDGATQGPVVSQGEADIEPPIESLAAVGTDVTRVQDHGNQAPRVYLRGGVRAGLRRAGLLGAKAIPAVYLRASLTQRLRLLRGLMDTDGHATPRGWCTFVTKDRHFARQVAELARTLGYRPTILVREETRSRTREMVKVSFQSSRDMIPFTLPRKVARCSGPKTKRARRWRSVVAVVPVPSVPVRCLAVDNADHLFLVGEGMVPTHNTHRFTLARLIRAHTTMLANLPKRKRAEPWSLETTTMFAPGEGSVAEQTMEYARSVSGGKTADSKLFFFHRQASEEKHDLATDEGLRAAVIEASGPVAEWTDIEAIVDQWKDPTRDKAYLRRVWLNQAVKSSDRAFDPLVWARLAKPAYKIPRGALVTIGFDGARRRDSTAIVVTEVETFHQVLAGLWEKPPAEKTWEIDAASVKACMADLFETYDVWKVYADPAYWESTVDDWSGEYGEDRVVKRWTGGGFEAKTAYAVLAYFNAQLSGEMSHDGTADFARHVANAYRKPSSRKDDEGKPLWSIQKERADSPLKIDAAMAGVLSAEARGHAVAEGATSAGPSVYETRGVLTV